MKNTEKFSGLSYPPHNEKDLLFSEYVLHKKKEFIKVWELECLYLLVTVLKTN